MPISRRLLGDGWIGATTDQGTENDHATSDDTYNSGGSDSENDATGYYKDNYSDNGTDDGTFDNNDTFSDSPTDDTDLGTATLEVTGRGKGDKSNL